MIILSLVENIENIETVFTFAKFMFDYLICSMHSKHFSLFKKKNRSGAKLVALKYVVKCIQDDIVRNRD